MTLLLVILLLAAEAVRCARRRVAMLGRLGVLMLALAACLLVSDALTPAVQGAARWTKGVLAGVGSQAHGPGVLPLGRTERTEGAASEEGAGRPRHGRMERLDLHAGYTLTESPAAEAYLVFDVADARMTDYRERLYLRTFAFDTFDGRSWMSTLPLQPASLCDQEDGNADGWTMLGPGGVALLRYRVCLPGWRSAVLPCVPALRGIKLPEVLRYRNGLVASPAVFPLPFLAYTAQSYPTCWHPAQDAALPMGNPGPEYGAVPAGALGERIAELARTIVGDDDPPAGEAARRLMLHLRTGYRYAREVRNPERLEPLENFLFHEKAGHCELFATGYALLLRAAGVPARVAVGYCGGEYDAERHVLTYTSDDAHAWTELFLQDGGWTIADATPPDSEAAPTAPRPGSAPDDFSPARFAELDGLIAGIRSREAAAARNEGTAGAGEGAWSWLAGAVLLAAALGILAAGRLRTRFGRRGGRARMVAPPEVSTFLRLFLRHFAREGHPRRPGRTLREYVAELKARGCIGSEYDSMVDYVYAISYRGVPREPERERRMVRWLKRALREAR